MVGCIFDVEWRRMEGCGRGGNGLDGCDALEMGLCC